MQTQHLTAVWFAGITQQVMTKMTNVPGRVKHRADLQSNTEDAAGNKLPTVQKKTIGPCIVTWLNPKPVATEKLQNQIQASNGCSLQAGFLLFSEVS